MGKSKSKKVDQGKQVQKKVDAQPQLSKKEQNAAPVVTQTSNNTQTHTQKYGPHGRKHQSSKKQKHAKFDKGDESDKSRHFTWEEVDDIWLVIEENVYDVTKFVDNHPGGVKPIIHRAGRNATKVFHEGNHPPNVLSHKLGKWKIGRIQQDSMIESWQRQTKTGKMDAFCSFVLGFGLLGFSVYLAL